MDRQSTGIIVNKAELAKLIHEMTDPRPGGADHLRQRCLIYFGQHEFGSAFLAKMGQQQEDPSQTLFARNVQGASFSSDCY
jgi:hypothetical protein